MRARTLALETDARPRVAVTQRGRTHQDRVLVWRRQMFTSNTHAPRGSEGSMDRTRGSDSPQGKDGVDQHASSTVEVRDRS